MTLSMPLKFCAPASWWLHMLTPLFELPLLISVRFVVRFQFCPPNAKSPPILFSHAIALLSAYTAAYDVLHCSHHILMCLKILFFLSAKFVSLADFFLPSKNKVRCENTVPGITPPSCWSLPRVPCWPADLGEGKFVRVPCGVQHSPAELLSLFL